MMQYINNIKIIKIGFYLINILFGFLIIFIVFHSIEQIYWEGGARDFITNNSLRHFNIQKERILLIYILCWIVIIICNYCMFKVENNVLVYILMIIIILFAVLYTYLISNCSTGIMLQVITIAMSKYKKIFPNTIFCSICIILFILLDNGSIILFGYLEVLGINYIFPIQRLFNIVSILNQLLFLLFIVIILQKEYFENEENRKNKEIAVNTANKLMALNSKLQIYAYNAEETAKIKERNRIFNEIHDTVGHYLTGIIEGLDAAQQLIQIDLDLVQKQIGSIAQLARTSLDNVRKSVKAEKRDNASNIGFKDAIYSIVSDMKHVIKLDFVLDITDCKINNSYFDPLLNIIMEGITNCIKHSQATVMKISLSSVGNQTFKLIITDNGIGCDNYTAGTGLNNIIENTKAINGNVNIESKFGRGFKIEVCFREQPALLRSSMT